MTHLQCGLEPRNHDGTNLALGSCWCLQHIRCFGLRKLSLPYAWKSLLSVACLVFPFLLWPTLLTCSGRAQCGFEPRNHDGTNLALGSCWCLQHIRCFGLRELSLPYAWKSLLSVACLVFPFLLWPTLLTCSGRASVTATPLNVTPKP